MRRTRLKILLAAAIFVMVAAAIGLIVTLTGRDKPEGTKKTAIPEAPEGSVLVWLRTAEYYQENGGEVVCTARYTYDEYGRCVKKEDIPINAYEDEKVTTVEYDEATHQSIKTSLFGIEEPIGKECSVYAANGDTISDCVWEYTDDRYVKLLETLYELCDDGKYEYSTTVRYTGGIVDQVIWWEYNKTKSSRFGKKADLYCLAEKYTDNDDWQTIKAAAEWNEVLTSWEEYDEQGRLVSVSDVEPDRTIVLTSYTEYLDGGVIKEHNCADGTCMTTYVDEQGRTTRAIHSYEDTESVYMTREYEFEELDSGGCREMDHISDESGAKVYFIERDEKGRLVRNGEVIDGRDVVARLITRDAADRIIRDEWSGYESTEYEYDENGNCVKEIIRYEEGEIINTTEYTPIVLEKDKAAYAESFYDPFRNADE